MRKAQAFDLSIQVSLEHGNHTGHVRSCRCDAVGAQKRNPDEPDCLDLFGWLEPQSRVDDPFDVSPHMSAQFHPLVILLLTVSRSTTP